MSFGKFLAKHSDELRDVAQLFGGVISLLPIGRQDKRRLGKIISGLEQSADNIHKAAEKAVGETGDFDRAILKEIMREVVTELLPDIVGGVSEKETRAAVTDKPKRVRKKAAVTDKPKRVRKKKA